MFTVYKLQIICYFCHVAMSYFLLCHLDCFRLLACKTQDETCHMVEKPHWFCQWLHFWMFSFIITGCRCGQFACMHSFIVNVCVCVFGSLFFRCWLCRPYQRTWDRTAEVWPDMLRLSLSAIYSIFYYPTPTPLLPLSHIACVCERPLPQFPEKETLTGNSQFKYNTQLIDL